VPPHILALFLLCIIVCYSSISRISQSSSIKSQLHLFHCVVEDFSFLLHEFTSFLRILRRLRRLLVRMLLVACFKRQENKTLFRPHILSSQGHTQHTHTRKVSRVQTYESKHTYYCSSLILQWVCLIVVVYFYNELAYQILSMVVLFFGCSSIIYDTG